MGLVAVVGRSRGRPGWGWVKGVKGWLVAEPEPEAPQGERLGESNIMSALECSAELVRARAGPGEAARHREAVEKPEGARSSIMAVRPVLVAQREKGYCYANLELLATC
jgi:hypothetical protein